MARFVTVARRGEIPVGGGATVVAGGRRLALFNCGGELLAVDALCTHAEAELADGAPDCAAGAIECWLHGALFDLRSGKVLRGPASEPLASYPVRLVGDEVQVALPDPAP